MASLQGLTRPYNYRDASFSHADTDISLIVELLYRRLNWRLLTFQ